jgi:hypothetical protein
MAILLRAIRMMIPYGAVSTYVTLLLMDFPIMTLRISTGYFHASIKQISYTMILVLDILSVDESGHLTALLDRESSSLLIY